MDEIKRESRINIEGVEGDSLFRRPIITIVNQENFKDIQEKVDSYFEKYNAVSDDRALAIIGALIIENELDVFLSSWIKKYKHIQNARELSFSLKVEIAVSLNIIPAYILNAIEPIRKIRNLFAHHLDLTTFEDARKFDSKEEKPVFPKLYDKIRTITDWNKENDKETFTNLIFLIVLGLNIYAKHAAKVQSHLWNTKNINAILKS